MDLVLDREHIRQLLLRPDFYAACPEFTHLQAVAEETRQAAVRQCGHCINDWVVYRNVIDAFFLRIQMLNNDAASTAIERLKDYLGAKKGYRPTTLTLYYRGRGQGPVRKLCL